MPRAETSRRARCALVLVVLGVSAALHLTSTRPGPGRPSTRPAGPTVADPERRASPSRTEATSVTPDAPQRPLPVAPKARSLHEEGPAADDSCVVVGTVRAAAGLARDSYVMLLDATPSRDSLYGRDAETASSPLETFCRLITSPLRRPLLALLGMSESGPRLCPAKDGTYRFDGVPSGLQFRIGAFHEDVGVALRSGLVADAHRSPMVVDLDLVQGSVVTGVVTDEDGAAIEGAHVSMRSVVSDPGGEARSSPVVSCTTDRLGVFRSPSLPFARLQVTVFKPEFYVAGPEVIELADPPAEHRMDFILQRARVLDGRVIALSGAEIFPPGSELDLVAIVSRQEPTSAAAPSLLDGQTAAAVNRDDSRYRLVWRHRDLQYVSVWCRGACLGSARIDPVGDRPDVVIDLARLPGRPSTGTLDLEVMDGAGESPVTAFTVECAQDRLTSPAFLNPRISRRFVRDESGRASIDGLPPGRYDCFVSAPGFAVRVDSAIVGAGGTTHVRVALERSSRELHGKIEDEDHQPVAGARLRLLVRGEGDAAFLPVLATTTSESGEFLFGSLTDATHALVVSHDRFAAQATIVDPTQLALSSADHPTMITLTAGWAVDLEPIACDGDRTRRFLVRVWDASDVCLYDGSRDSEFSGLTGKARVRLNRGDYRATLTTDRGELGAASFSVTGEQRIRVDVGE